MSHADRSRPLAGRTAVITGGGRGVGAAVARRLAADGARIVVAARSAAEIDAVATAITSGGGEAAAITVDVADPSSITALFAEARRRFARVDILINNAGVALAAAIAKTTLAQWNQAMLINATAPFLCTQACLPEMSAAGWGRIVNIASTAAISGDRYIAAYAASKHALLGLTRSAAAEAAAHGVTVNAVCPGFLATEMTEQSIARIMTATGRSREEAVAAIVARNPQRRLIEPDEVADAVSYLCSDGARSINGSTVVIDGGERG